MAPRSTFVEEEWGRGVRCGAPGVFERRRQQRAAWSLALVLGWGTVFSQILQYVSTLCPYNLLKLIKLMRYLY